MGALVVSLAIISMSTMIVRRTYPSVFEMNPSEKIFVEQRNNQEFMDWAGEDLSFTSIVLEFGSIRNTIGANAKTSHWPILLFPADPKSIPAQILLQSLPRASPP